MNLLKFPLIVAVLLISSAQIVLAEETPIQTSSAESVYFVDMQKIIDESIIGKAARSDIEAEARKRQVGLDAKRNDLVKLKEDLEKQKALLSPAALSEREQNIERRQRELMREFDDEREALGKKNSAEMKKVVDEIDSVVKELSAKNNYPLVVERDPRLVIYANSKWDLSGEVIRILNEKKLGT